MLLLPKERPFFFGKKINGIIGPVIVRPSRVDIVEASGLAPHPGKATAAFGGAGQAQGNK